MNVASEPRQRIVGYGSPKPSRKVVRLAVIVLLILLWLLAYALSGAAPGEDVCPVHGIKMEHRAMRLVYGMPSQAEFEEMKVAKARFPHGRDYVLAGCVVRPAKTASGYLCPKCVEAREAWLRARRR